MAVEDPFPSVVMTPEGVDPDRMRLASKPDFGPSFSIGEVAKFFFARKTYWVRWRERSGLFALDDGTGSQPRRSEHKARVYYLGDVERMIFGLLGNRKMDSLRAGRCLAIVYACAANYEEPAAEAGAPEGEGPR